MTTYALAIAEFLLLVTAAFGLSCFILKRDSLEQITVWEFVVLRTALGFGIIAYVTFLAAVLRFLNLSLFIAVLVLGSLCFLREISILKELKIRITFSLFGSILAIFFLFNFFYAWFPPTFYDSMLYHLAVPSYYIFHHGFVPWPTNFLAHLPLNVEMVFMFTLLGKTVLLPKLLSLISYTGLIILVYSWYRRHFSSRFSLLPVLLFFTIPQVGFLTTTAKPDMLGLLFLFAGVRLFFLYLEKEKQKRLHLLLLSSLCWGLAIGSKYIFAFYLVGFFLALLLAKKVDFKRKVLAVLVITLVVLLLLSPWLAKNAVFTGNPVYPYLSGIFPNQYWSSQQAADFSFMQKRGSGYSLWQYLWYPIQIFILPYGYGMTVVLGVLFLIFIPFIFFSWKDERLRFLIIAAAAAFILMLFFSKVPRYFLTSFLLLAMPMAGGAEKVMARVPAIKKFLPLLLTLLLAANLVQQVDLQERYSQGFSFLFKKIGGKLKAQDYRYLYLLPYYRAANYANLHLDKDDLLILLGEERTFYLDKRFIASSFVDRNFLIEDLKKSQNFEDFAAALRKRTITHILYSPLGLERLGRKSLTHRLSDNERHRLHDYLSHFPLVYQDKNYLLFNVGGGSGSRSQID